MATVPMHVLQQSYCVLGQLMRAAVITFVLGPCMARVLQDLQCHAGPITVVCAQNAEMCAWC